MTKNMPEVNMLFWYNQELRVIFQNKAFHIFPSDVASIQGISTSFSNRNLPGGHFSY